MLAVIVLMNNIVEECSNYIGAISRTLVKSAYQNTNFLISQPKHMLWVLKRPSQ